MLWAGRAPDDLSGICTWGSGKELGLISCACLASHRREQELTDTLIPDIYVNTVLSTEGRLLGAVACPAHLCSGVFVLVVPQISLFVHGYGASQAFLSLLVIYICLFSSPDWRACFFFFQNSQVVLSVLGVQKKN